MVAIFGQSAHVRRHLVPYSGNGPLPKQCMTNNIIYKATVTMNNTNDTKHYIGMTATTFKERYANHTSSFRHKKDSNKTELSKHIWRLKENNQDYTIKWLPPPQAFQKNKIGAKRTERPAD